MAFSFGPLVGIFYAGLLHIVFNSMGMGSGVVLNIFLSKIFESGVIGLVAWKNKNIFTTVLIPLILSLLIHPISYIFYGLNNSGVSYSMEIYLNYLQTNFSDQLVVYIISSFIGYGIYKFLAKNNKEKRF